jgi:hypothetical protein
MEYELSKINRLFGLESWKTDGRSLDIYFVTMPPSSELTEFWGASFPHLAEFLLDATRWVVLHKDSLNPALVVKL